MNGKKLVISYVALGVVVAAGATVFFNFRRTAAIKSAGMACSGGKDAAALSACDKALELDPANTLAYTLSRAGINAALGKAPEAMADYGKAISSQGKTPAAAETWLALGKLKVSRDDNAGAVSAFSHAVTLNPKLAEAYAGRAAANAATGNVEAAAKDFGAAIEINPADAAAFNGRAAIYLNAGMLNEAAADAEKAVTLSPKTPEGYITRAMAYQGLGKWKESAQDCAKLIEISPSPAAYSCRADASFMLKDYKQAVADYTKAVSLDPAMPETYISRGVALRADGQYDKSLPDFNKAQELNPDVQNIYFERALSSLCLNDFKAAEDDLDKAAAFEELQPRYHVVRAALLYAKSKGKDRAGAVAALQAAHDLGGPDALACINNADDAGRFLAPLARRKEVARLLVPFQKAK